MVHPKRKKKGGRKKIENTKCHHSNAREWSCQKFDDDDDNDDDDHEAGNGWGYEWCLCVCANMMILRLVTRMKDVRMIREKCGGICTRETYVGWMNKIPPIFQSKYPCTMGQNRKKHRVNNHVPREREWVKWVSAAERAREASRAKQAQRVSGASEQANGRASGPVLQSVFLVILAHSAMLLYSLNPPEFTH